MRRADAPSERAGEGRRRAGLKDHPKNGDWMHLGRWGLNP
jgi:hypothetical protein